MHDELWAGVSFKLESAFFHFQRMETSINPPALSGTYAAIEAARGIVDRGWQRSLYPHLDALLSATRSVPWIIKCCFGKDTANSVMKAWFKVLPLAEQDCRTEFQKQFQSYHDAFSNLPLSGARDVSVHRTGLPKVEAKITGMFGVIYQAAQLSPSLFQRRVKSTIQIYSFSLRPARLSQDGMT